MAPRNSYGLQSQKPVSQGLQLDVDVANVRGAANATGRGRWSRAYRVSTVCRGSRRCNRTGSTCCATCNVAAAGTDAGLGIPIPGQHPVGLPRGASRHRRGVSRCRGACGPTTTPNPTPSPSKASLQARGSDSTQALCQPRLPRPAGLVHGALHRSRHTLGQKLRDQSPASGGPAGGQGLQCGADTAPSLTREGQQGVTRMRMGVRG
jgi:hypothetical protein